MHDQSYRSPTLRSMPMTFTEKTSPSCSDVESGTTQEGPRTIVGACDTTVSPAQTM